MSNYAIFFDYNNATYRLPVNPEQIETATVQAIEKYEILKLGQIGIPTHMELAEYSFEAEFPTAKANSSTAGALIGAAVALGFNGQDYLGIPHYVETSGDFRSADYYLNLFKTWRDKLIPVRFIANNGIGDEINSLVLIEEMNVVEKAGEEGDKYVSFQLLEYREFGVKVEVVKKSDGKAKKKTAKKETSSPKSTGSHVVQSGESLWAIAKKYYGDGSKCNIIYNANKDKIKNPSVLQIGWKLKIPDKSEFTKYNSPLPKSTAVKEIDAKAFIQAYAANKSLAGFGSGW